MNMPFPADAGYPDEESRATVTTLLRAQYAHHAAEAAEHARTAEGLDQQVAQAAAELIRVTGSRDDARHHADQAHHNAEAFRIALTLNGASNVSEGSGVEADPAPASMFFRPFIPAESPNLRFQADHCQCGALMAWDERQGFYHPTDQTPAAALCERQVTAL